MTIPASQIVQVNPGVLAAAGSAVDLNGLILTQSTYPPMGAVVPFSSPDDVAAYFGPASKEARDAAIYFHGYDNSTQKPGKLYLAQYPVQAVPAYLRGASVESITLPQLQALSGAIYVEVDGVVHSSTKVSLSSVTSFSQAAQTIGDGLSLTVTFDSVQKAFVVLSGTTGIDSTITDASGSLADALLLSTAKGSVISQGADAAMPETFMDGLVRVTQNWAAFTTLWEPDTEAKTAFSAWTNSRNNRFAYAGWDTDPNAKISHSTTTWGYAVKQASYDGSILVFGDSAHAAFVLGAIASIDFNQPNGRSTLAFKQQSGLTPSASDETEASNLIDNGYNFYGAYATASQDFTFFYPGRISGKWEWVDPYINQIWLNANLQLALFTLLGQAGSIPYNDAGRALIEAAIMDPINAAITFGAIRKGVALSASQAQQIKTAVGQDVSTTITASGYYLQIQSASPAVRTRRGSPPMSLYYTDGGSIQQLKLASIDIE